MGQRTGNSVTTQAEAADLVRWRRAQWEVALDAIRVECLRVKAELGNAPDAMAIQVGLNGLS